eukprot:CAMPEP_0194171380 /NCGR_PEP_ID=MMETSP0154-20130528/5965_1 /TAXON_ID=1049557 /ORGANISM="Thalassiothrix antarctica, Strain L6-D1" /LENGTH=495 /DNA_ID=CAMNT_0038883657 /DNA_START=92 /DNA_END=1579 /DNA_ORIENTATION=-
MASIPADDTIVLGSVIHPSKITYFQKVSEIESPVNSIEDHLNTLIESSHNFEMMYNEMINMGVEQEDLMKMKGEQKKLKKEMAKTAINLGNATIMSQNKLRILREREGAKITKVVPNSPIDWSQTELKHLPLAADSMSLDVHYFRNEDSADKVAAHAQSISKHISETFTSGRVGKRKSNLGKSAHNSVLKQTNNHNLEGTIIITADCLHKQAVVMDPFIIDPVKSVAAWNLMYPDDPIETDPKSIYESALAKTTDSSNTMHVLSGMTKGSSFVGMVHLLKQESTKSAQTGASMATEMRQEMSKYLVMSEQSGSFGPAEQVSESMKALVSDSGVRNHCTIHTEGVIPNITSSSMMTSVANLKPSPKEIMEQLSAISSASDGVVNNSMEAMAAKAKTGAQFIKLNSEYIKNTVSVLGKYDQANNKVIDMNSLMDAFTDYVQKAIEGKSGTAVLLNIREVHKKDIASSYINKYYPNGVEDDAKFNTLGQLGIERKKEE